MTVLFYRPFTRAKWHAVQFSPSVPVLGIASQQLHSIAPRALPFPPFQTFLFSMKPTFPKPCTRTKLPSSVANPPWTTQTTMHRQVTNTKRAAFRRHVEMLAYIQHSRKPLSGLASSQLARGHRGVETRHVQIQTRRRAASSTSYPMVKFFPKPAPGIICPAFQRTELSATLT